MFVVTVAGVVVGLLQWRRPVAPPEAPRHPPRVSEVALPPPHIEGSSLVMPQGVVTPPPPSKKPKKPKEHMSNKGDKDEKGTVYNGPVYNVTSNNQSGGITAGQVNFERPPWRINDGIRAQLRSMVRKETKVSVTSVQGDGDASMMAYDIRTFLKADGFNIDANVISSESVFIGPPVIGLQLHDKNGGQEIIVGHRPPDTPVRR